LGAGGRAFKSPRPDQTPADSKELDQVAPYRFRCSFVSTVDKTRFSRTLCRTKTRTGFVPPPVEFLQIPFIALAEQLRHPLVRHAAGAEPGRVRRAESVDAQLRRLRPPQRGVPGGLQRLLMTAGILIAREKVLAAAPHRAKTVSLNSGAAVASSCSNRCATFQTLLRKPSILISKERILSWHVGVGALSNNEWTNRIHPVNPSGG
jgi:hypothetical protein